MIPDWIRESNLIEDIDDPREDLRSLRAWNWFKHQALTVGTILQLHRKITRMQLEDHEAGHFRKHNVEVGRIPIEANWQDVPDLVATWVACAQYPAHIEGVKSYHVGFEKIHPFIDGNGRTGRMIMNWMMIRNNMEPICIKAVDRQAYYAWFRR